MVEHLFSEFACTIGENSRSTLQQPVNW